MDKLLSFLQHKNDLHLRIQEMEPPITEVGRTLEEALELQKEHNECLAKLLVNVVTLCTSCTVGHSVAVCGRLCATAVNSEHERGEGIKLVSRLNGMQAD